jgi:hypothetical protein
VGHDEQGIGGIEAESHDVEFRHAETIVRGAEGNRDGTGGRFPAETQRR